MKIFKLLFVAALSTIILIGCERQLVSPIDPTDPSKTTAQFAQSALSDLADTAAERGFVDLANAASDVAETLAMDNGTSVEPTFSKLAKLANEVTPLGQAFVSVGCSIELWKFAEASMNTVKAYTIRNAPDMEQALQNLAETTLTAEAVLRQFPTENAFIPFAFGYDFVLVRNSNYVYPNRQIKLGAILVQYESETRLLTETRAAVIELLTQKGYTVPDVRLDVEPFAGITDEIYVGAPVDPILLGRELIDIPGVALVRPSFRHFTPTLEAQPPSAPPPHIVMMEQVKIGYNIAWCHGSFEFIDSTLIKKSGLDFFDYAFVRNLADIYAEEIPETAERIRTNRFFLGSIAEKFLEIYLQNSEKTLEEVIEIFRQLVRIGYVSIERSIYSQYYVTTDYWQQLVTDHLNQ